MHKSHLLPHVNPAAECCSTHHIQQQLEMLPSTTGHPNTTGTPHPAPRSTEGPQWHSKGAAAAPAPCQGPAPALLSPLSPQHTIQPSCVCVTGRDETPVPLLRPPALRMCFSSCVTTRTVLQEVSQLSAATCSLIPSLPHQAFFFWLFT